METLTQYPEDSSDICFIQVDCTRNRFFGLTSITDT